MNKSTDTSINSDEYVQHVIYLHLHDELIDNISNTIVKFCKKENHTEQAVWASDTSRLTYIIRGIFMDETTQWITDKKGIKTCSYVVDPILKVLRRDLKEYTTKVFDPDEIADNYDPEQYMDYMVIGRELVDLIDDGTLRNDINRKIAPLLYMPEKLIKAPDIQKAIENQQITNDKINEPLQPEIIQQQKEAEIVQQPKQSEIIQPPKEIEIIQTNRKPRSCSVTRKSIKSRK